MSARTLRIAIVAGEASGDQLGASFIRALRARGLDVELLGVGGPEMSGEGMTSLFPQSDIAVMGLGPVIRRLPLLIRRIRETADFLVREKPDLLLTIDSPDFTKRVAKRVRAAAPEVPILHWVCPSVWAWRPGRAPAMRPYIDHVLCLLPFEPAALERLKGPKGSFIGHPLIERAHDLRPQDDMAAAARATSEKPTVLILPGSRNSEIKHLLADFLAAIDRAGLDDADLVLPTLPHIEARVREIVSASGLPVRVIVGEAAKREAMRLARVALAASGTVTLELAVAQIPMITAYRMANWEAFIARRLVTASSAILPNLILSENIVPEFLQEAATPDALAAALLEIIPDGDARARQLDAFYRLDTIMRSDGVSPSSHAVDVALGLIRA
jgi:lipid-A-disaccharide synthase